MKKITAALLALLMLISLASCEKDKSGEMITNYEEFAKGYNATYMEYLVLRNYYGDIFEKESETEIKEINLENNEKTTTEFVKSLISLVTTDDIEPTDISASGTISGTDSKNEVSATLTGIIITYKYQVDEKNEKEGKIILSGTITMSKEEKDGYITASCVGRNLTQDGKTLKNVTYSFRISSGNGFDSFTSATVDGKNVELRLVNTQVNKFIITADGDKKTEEEK